MVFWKLFGSEEKVRHAIEESVGYNISPTKADILQLPANDAKHSKAALSLLPVGVNPTPVDNTANMAEPYSITPAEKWAAKNNDGETDADERAKRTVR